MASTSTWDLPRVHPGASPESSRQVICSSLQAVRHHLGMEVAFVGRFDHGRRIFVFVDTGDTFCPIHQGDSERRWRSTNHWDRPSTAPDAAPATNPSSGS